MLSSSTKLDEAGASLPNVEELRTSLGGRTSSSSRRRNTINSSDDNNTKVSLKWVWIGATLSFLLLVIVLPVVSVKQNQRNNNSNTIDDSSNNLSRGPDAGAKTRPRPALQDVKQFVLENAISSAAALETEGSPQQRAALWLRPGGSGQSGRSHGGYH